MPNRLIIVESPTKVKTIKKFLGSNYQVIASNGHIRDLPKSSLGIDIENDFEPKYITIRGKGDKLSEIKKAAKKADYIYLATDPDREGEAISWHISNCLPDTNKKVSRITFNEITRTAVKNALKKPRSIDMNLVNAQQARRTADRIVGYSISPILWKKIKKGLSAGRVQSVALKLISDRDKEISEFKSEEYYSIEAIFRTEKGKKFNASFYQFNDEDIDIGPKVAKKILDEIENSNFYISSIKKNNRRKSAPQPFTTSTLQQEASKKLGFPVSKTMRTAQDLYEGIKVEGLGTVGLITYLRTDSIRISDEAKEAAKNYIENCFGIEYLGNYKNKKVSTKIQDAHEAIRPTYLELEPSIIFDSLSRDQLRLYTLIWNRFLASQMADAMTEVTSVVIGSDKGYTFKSSTSKLTFKGYMSIYDLDPIEKNNASLSSLKEDSGITLDSVDHKVHYTEPPAHFTEASLIKTLESLGIGRPSTYAPTVATLKARRYITIDKKQIYATELGNIVNDIMKRCFKEIVDVKFTAKMEESLDEIAEGSLEWKELLRRYYPILSEELQVAEKKLEKVVILDEVTDEICEKCGKNMVVKYGPHGKFLACPGFPKCKNSRPFFVKIGVKCPLCGGDIVERLTPKNRKYYGCINYPDCNFATWKEPTGKICPTCGDYLIKQNKKVICANKKCKYEEK